MKESLSVSFEGGRGCGKSSIAAMLIEDSTKPVYVNRLINTDLEKQTLIAINKEESLFHKESLEYHSMWLDSFDEEGIPINPLISEELSLKKFDSICKQIQTEKDFYAEYLLGKKDADVILDRYLDTIVVYGAAELFLSNPLHYNSEKEQRDLVGHLWKKVLAIDPVFPKVTFYLLSQRDYQEALFRSWNVHEIFGQKYCLDSIQEKIQELTVKTYQYSYDWCKENSLGRDEYMINIDDKDKEEVFHIIYRLLHKLDDFSAKEYKSLPIYGAEKPQNIEALISLICKSSTGARFPSIHEVESIGTSNCLYNNFSLQRYAKSLLKKDLSLVSVNFDEYGDCPVHWQCLEIDETQSYGRLLDASPFKGTQKYSNWLKIDKFSGSHIFLASDEALIDLYVETTELPLLLMEFAHDIEIKPFSESLYNEGMNIFKHLSDNSSRIFWGIRLRRLLYKGGKFEEANSVMSTLMDYYPKSLVIGRELAKNILHKSREPSRKEREYLTGALFLFNLKYHNLEDEVTKKRFMEYYTDIINLDKQIYERS